MVNYYNDEENKHILSIVCDNANSTDTGWCTAKLLMYEKNIFCINGIAYGYNLIVSHAEDLNTSLKKYSTITVMYQNKNGEVCKKNLIGEEAYTLLDVLKFI